MRILTIIFIFSIIISCKPKPTYNAFDDLFDISLKQVVKDGCDTISAGCGWFNLTQKKGRLRNYYQIYGEKVDAKGFVYYLDTINIKGIKNYDNIYSLKISEKNINEFNSELEKYYFKFLEQNLNKVSEMYEIRITNYSLTNTISLGMNFKWINKKDSIIVRTINYWRPFKN
jgi:hypothetical protein